MSELKNISTALISVYHKNGLDNLVQFLHDRGVIIFATGGTMDFISAMGIPVIPVEEVTGYPSILGGRVKTLHPGVFGGILGRRNNRDDLDQMEKYGIPGIDLVVVDLYPFSATVASGAAHDEIIEKIDIGGISLIRAAAKNYQDVVIVPSVTDYPALTGELTANNGSTTLEFRKKQARHAFAVSSHYDTCITEWFTDGPPDYFKASIMEPNPLRYGENPHQRGIFYGRLNDVFEQLSGKELSYNNLLDIDAAVNLSCEFEEPVTAILKHNNACGVSAGNHSLVNWELALKSDPVSAFGGVIITTSPVDEPVAAEIGKLFFEVLIAPDFTGRAFDILSSKKNRILLKMKKTEPQQQQFRTILNGVLWQDRDSKSETEADLRTVTQTGPSPGQVNDLLFANKIVKHSRSNTIVLAKDNCLIAAGVGQTSRVDALHQAIQKARSFDLSLQGAVMASDAFFPFPDCVEIAHKAGIKAIIQPGGSVRDQDSIDYCDTHKLAMVFTGFRHFRH